ncbi:hypothetical protein DesfrDRAFT_1388 [Solidesulfovibrio fructosivorans JJ]]|uniref:Uncharacterized protein n=1 Tax=Solidesulfovibrio fructosivorans JJ] TaxID=596151 RepID=E1JUT9_SOLFR|nr:hypothetical protein [Solidesulfovibrio fructosivorans]EFL51853.1 hypothetical protein DesfrDRAFT_1388 [Solidesulfovibrio fructosivorans JJ]]
MDSTTLAQAFEGYKELVNHAMDEGHEIADALGFLAQAVDDMNHNDREWSVGALILFLRALEKQARDLGTYMDEEGTARSPKPTAEESALHEKQDAASRVWSEGMRVIYQHPDLAGDVADALKKIVAKVKTEAGEVEHA